MRVAMVIGGAASVYDDFRAAAALGQYDGFLAANAIITVWKGPLTAAVSLHRELLPLYLRSRARKGLEAPEQVFGADDADHYFPGQKTIGSSGLFALKIALEDLGFDRAVLVGVPMDAAVGHFDDPVPTPWDECPGYLDGWREAMPRLRDRVRSVSGWTRDALGYPTASWIKGDLP